MLVGSGSGPISNLFESSEVVFFKSFAALLLVDASVTFRLRGRIIGTHGKDGYCQLRVPMKRAMVTFSRTCRPRNDAIATRMDLHEVRSFAYNGMDGGGS